MLRFKVRLRHRKMGSVEGLGSGVEGRIKRLRKLVTGLIRYERIETAHSHGDEARGYAERLIQVAIKNGDKHRETMEMADFWLMEKDLIHKLFKVLVPRYQNYSTSYTQMWNLPIKYPGFGHQSGVLELKGNPWPPVRPEQRETKYLLSNILLQEARREYNQNKIKLDTASLDYTNKSSGDPFSDRMDMSRITETTDSSSPHVADTLEDKRVTQMGDEDSGGGDRVNSMEKDVDKVSKQMDELNVKDKPT
ncbi:39S ribosomal protein L17, mitochondrial-like [Gigantopelta aegis]|uniref:39S ribosomal protein L17, mitochondrial-like n=1 Tax=Gigantopelta aegis TaxID=1735272 RepID=UPI001B88DBC8|nr:39S ribosomal protein L17, mitochondrial-like [Gigantopelta aegis]